MTHATAHNFLTAVQLETCEFIDRNGHKCTEKRSKDSLYCIARGHKYTMKKRDELAKYKSYYEKQTTKRIREVDLSDDEDDDVVLQPWSKRGKNNEGKPTVSSARSSAQDSRKEKLPAIERARQSAQNPMSETRPQPQTQTSQLDTPKDGNVVVQNQVPAQVPAQVPSPSSELAKEFDNIDIGTDMDGVENTDSDPKAKGS